MPETYAPGAKPSTALLASMDVEGRDAGPLLGLTFVVKDNIDVAGLVSGNGHPAYAASHPPAREHAPPVTRLLAAGARLIGKAQMDEMAYSLLGANPNYGTPVNPKAPDRHPGGSSSGSAVATAAGLVDFALGTDTAGSCRAPASFCGVFGFRPSHGLLSLDGVVPLAPSFDTIGWFARDAQTLARVGAELLPVDRVRASFSAGAILSEAFTGCPEQESELLLGALAALRSDSAPREPTLGEEFWRSALSHFRNFQAYEAHRSQGAWVASERPCLSEGVAERFAYAARVSEEQKRASDAFRAEARERLDAFLGADGFFLLPTTPFFAPRLDENAGRLDEKRYAMMRLFQLASFFGLPQVSIPLATGDLPPLGLSVIGPRGSDRGLLAFSRSVATRAAD